MFIRNKIITFYFGRNVSYRANVMMDIKLRHKEKCICILDECQRKIVKKQENNEKFTIFEPIVLSH